MSDDSRQGPAQLTSYRLTVDATPASLSTARLFAAGVMVAIGRPELAEDVKLAVSELVTAALSGGADRITLEIVPEPFAVRVTPLASSQLTPDATAIVTALFNPPVDEPTGEQLHLSLERSQVDRG